MDKEFLHFEKINRETWQNLHRKTTPPLSQTELNSIKSFNDRINQLSQEKKAIAQKAHDFLKPEQIAFFDVSTIVLHLAQRIKEPMTIYSHSLDNAIMLSSQDKVDFHLLGGKFYPKNRFYYALNEAELLEQISFDIAFIGAASVSDGLVSFEDEADAHLKKLALK